MGRRSVFPHWAAGLVAFALLGAVATSTAAQPARAEEAIQKGREGVALYERGEWRQALTLFREADALFHSPVLTLYAARARRNLGELLEARELYAALEREAIDENAPRPWIQAQLDATAELKALDGEIPRVRIELAKKEALARATFDGAPVALGAPIAANPGEHRVEVTLGSRRVEKVVSLHRGETDARVVLDLVEPAAATPAPDGFRILGVVLTGAGGAALLVGGLTGGFALGAAQSAEERLPASCTADLECLPSERASVEAQYDSAHTLASVADGLLIGGGIVAVAGIVILILDPGGRSATPVRADRGGLRLVFQ